MLRWIHVIIILLNAAYLRTSQRWSRVTTIHPKETTSQKEHLGLKKHYPRRMLASSGLLGDDAPSLGECVSCWGAQIHGGATCVPQFVPGKHNFKNKFCDNCKQSIMVPADRICALTTELAARFANKRSEGFWNHAPASMGGGQYRILNNTASCQGPWLALFREQPPPFDWSATHSPRDRTEIELRSN